MRLKKEEAKDLREIVDRYNRVTGQEAGYDVREVIEWAVKKKLLKEPDEVIFDFYTPRFSEALRSDSLRLSDGSKVRTRFCVEVKGTDDEGKPFTRHLWSHLEDASDEFIRKSFRQRLKRIKADMAQIKSDLSYANEYLRARGRRTIQLRFADVLETNSAGGD